MCALSTSTGTEMCTGPGFPSVATLTAALASAYTRLYQNHDGLTDAWGMQWAEVAKRLASKPGLLGLELLNEPWR